MEDVNDWLQDLGLGDYVDVFAANGIDGEVLPHLSDQDLAGARCHPPEGSRKQHNAPVVQLPEGERGLPCR
jgi:hypothetical protein